MTDVTDERWLREAFDDFADGATVDPATDRAVAWHALRRRTRRRSQRRLGAIAAITAIAVVVAFVAWPNARGPVVNTVRPSTLPKLEVVNSIEGAWFEHPIAYDGHDVWLARSQGAVSGAPTVLERRDATTGRFLSSFEVDLPSVNAIAADGSGSLWLTSGGVEGVEPTVVTRVDAKTGRTVFSHTVPKSSCFCSIATGAGAVWLAGGSSDHLVRIDPDMGPEVEITLPGASYSLAVVGDRVQVGLDDARVAVVDPATNRIERFITARTPSLPAAGFVVSIEPVPTGPGGSDSWVTRSDGYAFSIVGNDHVGVRNADFLRPDGVVSTTVVGRRLWAVGVNQLIFDGIDAGAPRGFANYDRDGATFGPIVERTKRFIPVPEQTAGLDMVVAAGTTLWMVDHDLPRILVVQT